LSFEEVYTFSFSAPAPKTPFIGMLHPIEVKDTKHLQTVRLSLVRHFTEVLVGKAVSVSGICELELVILKPHWSEGDIEASSLHLPPGLGQPLP